MKNNGLVKFLKFWFPGILYSGIIFYTSSIPSVATPLQKIHFDKILHFLEYIPFGFLMARGIYSVKPATSVKILVMGVGLVTFLFGISDEYHQSFVVGRSSSIIDLIVDSAGGLIGGYIYCLLTFKNN
jgi:VanZ family protein